MHKDLYYFKTKEEPKHRGMHNLSKEKEKENENEIKKKEKSKWK